MELVKAQAKNIENMVAMNSQLFIDEQFDVCYSQEEITSQMNTFINGTTYDCYLIIENEICCGYCLLDKTRNPIYLRHLFVKSQFRKSGLGKNAIHQLMKIYNSTSLDIDVMAWNENAIKFYNKLGFDCRYHGMRIKSN